jgi:hypothetical protein
VSRQFATITLMDFAKKLALGLLSPLFIILLFATAFDVGFVRTATNSTTVKQLVAEGGIYHTAVPSILQQTRTISTNLGEVSTSYPIIKNAANAALTPQYIQQNAETVIDSIYEWLDGKTTQPDFKVDLSGIKTSFADNVAAAAKQRLSTLPKCKTLAQAQAFSALNASCVPPGLNLNIAAAQVKKSIAGEKDFLGKATLSADTFKNEGSGQSIFEGKYKNAPKQYQRAKKTPLILSVLTILTGLGIVFLSSSWQNGLRHVGIYLAIVGVLMLIFSWTLNRTVSTKVIPKITNENVILQQDIRILATDLTQQINKNYRFFGGLYALAGGGSIAAAEIFLRRTQPIAETENKSAPHAESTDEPKPAKKS